MTDRDASGDKRIPESLLLSRLAQGEQMREFFLQMWHENPKLAERAGKRIQELLVPLAPVNHEN
jgi:hypothetical protein